MNYSNIRKEQIEKIKIYNDNIPTLLIGDLNIKCFSQEFNSYDWQTSYNNNQFTFLEDKVIFDYILLLKSNSLFKLNKTLIKKINLSDHYPIISTFEY
jgi:endonuclease/exonuclease/phosphatase family metal-dependent hydrolase